MLYVFRNHDSANKIAFLPFELRNIGKVHEMSKKYGLSFIHLIYFYIFIHLKKKNLNMKNFN